MKHKNPDCSYIEIGSGNCPKCNMDKHINKGRAPKCPKCGSDNTTLEPDDRDEWEDLCIICFACGYDEREKKYESR